MARTFNDLTAGQASDQTIRAQQATIRELAAMVRRNHADIERLNERCRNLESLLARACVEHSGLAAATGLLHVR